MQRSPDTSSSHARPGYLAEVTLALVHIRDTNASGRLSIRNAEQFAIAHLYFKHARLVHVTGDKRDGEIVLNDLLSWSKGSIRLDTDATLDYEDVTWQQAQIFARWLAYLEMRGILGLLQGVAPAHLDGLAQSLTASLPGQPIALPYKVEHYEEYGAAAGERQWQRLTGGINQFVERTLTKEQRQQIIQTAKNTVQSIGQTVTQTARQVGTLKSQARSFRSLSALTSITGRLDEEAEV